MEIDFSPLRADSEEMMGPLSERADAVAAELEAPRMELDLDPEDGAAATVNCAGVGNQRV